MPDIPNKGFIPRKPLSQSEARDALDQNEVVTELESVHAKRNLNSDAAFDGAIDDDRVLLESGAAMLKSLATNLSERVSDFQQWLAKLPGRTDATINFRLLEPAYDAGIEPEKREETKTSIRLRFHRESQWVISYAYEHETKNSTTGFPMSRVSNWSLLTEAPIKIKLDAIEAFPALYEAIKQHHSKLNRRIITALATFNKFAAAAGMPVKEGK